MSEDFWREISRLLRGRREDCEFEAPEENGEEEEEGSISLPATTSNSSRDSSLAMGASVADLNSQDSRPALSLNPDSDLGSDSGPFVKSASECDISSGLFPSFLSIG